MTTIKKIVSRYGKRGAHINLPKEYIGKEVTIIIPDITEKAGDDSISKPSVKQSVKPEEETLDIDSIYNKLLHKNDGGNATNGNKPQDSKDPKNHNQDLEPYMNADIQKLTFIPNPLFENACLELKARYDEDGKSTQAELVIKEAIRRKKEFSASQKVKPTG